MLSKVQDFIVTAAVSDRHARSHWRGLTGFLAEVTADHANELGFGRNALGDGKTWMLSRLRVETDRWPRLGDVVRIRSWPVGLKGPFAIRDYELLDPNGEPWGLASSAWMAIDMERRRPIRIPREIFNFEQPDLPPPVMDGFRKMPRVKETSRSERTRVRWTDADMNGHANLGCYVGWAVDAHDHAFLDAHEPAQLHMEFRAEAQPGDVVHSATDGVTQSIVREEDGAELARVQLEWR